MRNRQDRHAYAQARREGQRGAHRLRYPGPFGADAAVRRPVQARRPGRGRVRLRQGAPRGRRQDGGRGVCQAEDHGRAEVPRRGRLPRCDQGSVDRHGLHRHARPLARLHRGRSHEARQGRLLREAAHVQRGRGAQGDCRPGEVRPRVPDGFDAAQLGRVPHGGDDRAQRHHRRREVRGRELRARRAEARRPVPSRPLLRQAGERGDGRRAQPERGLGHVARPLQVASVLRPARAARREQVLPDVLALRRRHRHGLQRRLGRAPPRHRAVGPRHGQERA